MAEPMMTREQIEGLVAEGCKYPVAILAHDAALREEIGVACKLLDKLIDGKPAEDSLLGRLAQLVTEGAKEADEVIALRERAEAAERRAWGYETMRWRALELAERVRDLMEGPLRSQQLAADELVALLAKEPKP